MYAHMYGNCSVCICTHKPTCNYIHIHMLFMHAHNILRGQYVSQKLEFSLNRVTLKLTNKEGRSVENVGDNLDFLASLGSAVTATRELVLLLFPVSCSDPFLFLQYC